MSTVSRLSWQTVTFVVECECKVQGEHPRIYSSSTRLALHFGAGLCLEMWLPRGLVLVKQRSVTARAKLPRFSVGDWQARPRAMPPGMARTEIGGRPTEMHRLSRLLLERSQDAYVLASDL
jgi:hypothetical protein